MTSQAAGHAGRPAHRRGAEIRRRLRRAGGILRVRQQAPGLGDDRAAARPRLAAAHRRICAIRSGRRSTSPANPSSTRWRRRSKHDPIEFRLQHIKEPRDVAVIKAAAEKSGWETRTSPRRDQTGAKVTGRGIAYSQRNGTRVAVDRRGRGRPLHRQDLGAQASPSPMIAARSSTPTACANAIEGNIVQGISRTLWEEVKFDRQDRHQRRLDHLSDPRHHRERRRRSTSC